MAIEERYVSGPGSLVFHVQLIGDQDATPDEYGDYDAEQKAAWQDCRWQFVGLVVGVQGFRASAGLWGIEYGRGVRDDGREITFDDILVEALDDLKAEAVKAARAERVKLNAIPLD
jgi:hypothetical protein